MKCDWCRRSLTESEPVHRVSVHYSFVWPDRRHRSIGYICAQCTKATIPVDLNPPIYRFCEAWHFAVQCSHCLRKVIHDTRRKIPKVVVCSEECRAATYLARARGRRKLGDKACESCGT